jgi:signal recognition particle GTPase
MENVENIQTKVPQKIIKPISFYHKYNCEPCQYHTNYKNNYNKHVKSAKHFSFTQSNDFKKEECAEKNKEKEEENVECNNNNTSDVISEQSLESVTGEQDIDNDTEEGVTNNLLIEKYKVEEINHLMDKLTINYDIHDVTINCIYFGMGFICNVILVYLFNVCG